MICDYVPDQFWAFCDNYAGAICLIGPAVLLLLVGSIKIKKSTALMLDRNMEQSGYWIARGIAVFACTVVPAFLAWYYYDSFWQYGMWVFVCTAFIVFMLHNFVGVTSTPKRWEKNFNRFTMSQRDLHEEQAWADAEAYGTQAASVSWHLLDKGRPAEYYENVRGRLAELDRKHKEAKERAAWETPNGDRDWNESIPRLARRAIVFNVNWGQVFIFSAIYGTYVILWLVT